jgi:hypothetical protein
MSECSKCHKYFVDALYHELTPGQQEFFDNHLQACSSCRLEFEKLQSTLKIMDLREQETLPEDFWIHFQRKLEIHLNQEEKGKRPHVVQFFNPLKMVRTFPRWTKYLAAAILLIAIGVFIGRYFNPGAYSPEPVTQIENPSSSFVQPAAVDDRAYHYLERSKILLLGIVNADPDAGEASTPDYSREKQVARGLIQEAAVLKDDLTDANRRKLYQLVSDLEVILLQIANLESQNDLPAVEMIRSGVDRRGILLKINLEEMERDNWGTSGLIDFKKTEKKTKI